MEATQQQQIKTKESIIRDIESGNFYLSFSSLSAFAESPASFIDYKLQVKAPTKAMKMGSALHCAILEPEEFEKRYLIFTKDMLPFPDSTMAKTENKLFKQQFEAQAEIEGKEIIDPAEHEECLLYQRLCWNNIIAKKYLELATIKESDQEWTFEGIKFRGRLDMAGPGMIMDLKKVMDASPNKIKRSALYDRWHWQGTLYLQSELGGEFTSFYNLCVDKVSPAMYEIDLPTRQIAHKEMKECLDNFKRCIDEQLWDCGYEFYCNRNSGIFTI